MQLSQFLQTRGSRYARCDAGSSSACSEKRAAGPRAETNTGVRERDTKQACTTRVARRTPAVSVVRNPLARRCSPHLGGRHSRRGPATAEAGRRPLWTARGEWAMRPASRPLKLPIRIFPRARVAPELTERPPAHSTHFGRLE